MKGFTQKYKNGVEEFYKNGVYHNPHTPIIQEITREYCNRHETILDLAAGLGEATNHLNAKVTAVEPYLPYPDALPYTFSDIIEGKLVGQFDAIICSFALHLVEPSRLPDLLYALADLSSILYIISPHKKPYVNHFKWELIDSKVHKRVHFRYYSIGESVLNIPKSPMGFPLLQQSQCTF